MGTPFDVYLYPGVDMHVTVPMKITCTPLGPSDVIPSGATVIPPQPSPTTAGMIAAAAAASLEATQKGQAAAEAVTAEGTRATHAALAQALAATNQEAAQVAGQSAPVTAMASPLAQAPPWEITFTGRRT